jgi:hypothetical protein
MWNPVSYQGPHVPMQLSCVAEEEDSEACSGCMNQVLIPTPNFCSWKASFTARENPYFPAPKAEDQRCLPTVLCRSVSIHSLPSGLKTQSHTWSLWFDHVHHRDDVWGGPHRKSSY